MDTAKHLNKAVYPFYQKVSFQLCDYKAAEHKLLSLAIASLLRKGHKLYFTLWCIGQIPGDALLDLYLFVLIIYPDSAENQL